MARTAVVLFNLGGPSDPDAVEPFLFNLFSDPAIIALPNPMRWLIARLVSRRRAPIAREIYAQIGGKSPLLDETRNQAQALDAALGPDFKTIIAMRYWHPLTAEAVAEVKASGAEQIVLLPLYPQYSTTTSASSARAWATEAKSAGLRIPTASVCCYPDQPGLIAALADGVRAGLAEAGPASRVLFSAHGLPKRVVDKGDPYPQQVERTAAAVVAALGGQIDSVVCYQSRVGPLEWIGPSTEDELARAGRDGVPVVVVPIAFVSEHSETLVELDIEYRHRARELGVPGYVRVPAVGCHPAFIAGLADVVRTAVMEGVSS
ncbi:MAG: ferrochelatase [Magnetospirillum sp.]|nr:ferrochelatase [Magnetospirillum sp.]